MNMQLITDVEIDQRQRDIRDGARRARQSFTISGVRQLTGNTFIAIGERLHGHCEKRSETRVPQPTPQPAHGV